MTRVVVLGAGFGGLAAATELRSLLDERDEVVVIDRRDHFAMGFAKLWDLAGMRPIEDGTRSLHDLAGRGIRYVRGEVNEVDVQARHVRTTDESFEADGIVIALGAPPSPAHRALLDAPGAYDLYDAAALPAMRQALSEIGSGRVVVPILGGPFKCPPAAYEAVLIVDGLLRARGVRDDVEVVLSTPQPMTLPTAGVEASRYLASHLDAHGVLLRPKHKVAAVDAAAQVISYAEDAGDIAYDLLLGVPADVVPPVLAGSGLVGGSGWVEPDPHTLRTAVDRVYAVGDCTMIPTASAQLPHAGVFAAAQGRVAARNLAADMAGSSPATFDGHGYCFLELPGEQVAFVEGNFYADPPDVALTEADHAQFLRKQAYEREHLAAWFD